MVAEHDIWMPKALEQLHQLSLASRPRQQVARDADEIGTALLDPCRSAFHGVRAARRHSEVEVREVRDPDAVELGRQARQPQIALAQTHPPGFEPAISEPGRGERGGSARNGRPEVQISSFSRIGRTETTWRRNLSSDSWRPAATPTSCERWRIGIA
jgi:hypothetical protein